MTTVLGIETSCDETSAAIVDDGRHVRSNVIASQIDLHRKYGGVVPEIASRAHIECLDGTLAESLEQAGCQPGDIDAIAVTNRPGLVGALLVGVTAAKTLAWAWRRPLLAVDHIRAHACSAGIGAEPAPWPAIALVASGGHTSLYHVHSPTHVDELGSTTDDAAGEAFDKVASILGLAYPGGPEIEKLGRTGDPRAIHFPRTWLGPESLDFSFSGIKTAVLYHVHGPGRTSGGLERLSDQQRADIAASFQQAVIDVLVGKTMLAASRAGCAAVTLGGGVAANRTLRDALATACAERNYTFWPTPMSYCTDNAAMIAAQGYHQLQAGDLADLDLDARPASR